MASEQGSENDTGASAAGDAPTHSQDSDQTMTVISSTGGGIKCLPIPESQSTTSMEHLTQDDLTTDSVLIASLQASSPLPYDSEMQLQPAVLSPLYQPTGDEPSAEIALVGRLQSISKTITENEHIELGPTDIPSAEDENQLIEEATDTGESSKMLLTTTIMPPVKLDSDDTLVAGTKYTDSANAAHRENANKIFKAVSEYYMEQFVDRWKRKTKEESRIITVIAALLVERNNKFKVVVLTAGTRIKYECSYFMKRNDHDESTWGLCDGHAEAVCYRLAGIYLLTELTKLRGDSIFEKKGDEGYLLKKGIKFHLFTSHPPCGFMAKKERHFLSWKRPFVGKPHSIQCSSTILIGAYLGIQGQFSHLLVKPIYISSITMPRYKTVATLQGSYIKERFEDFQRLSPLLSTSKHQYCLHLPHIEIVDTDPYELFKECYEPFINDEQPNKLPGKVNWTPEEVESNRKGRINKGMDNSKVAGTIPDNIYNAGINALVFTVDNGIGSQEFRESVVDLQCELSKLSHRLKEKRLKSLQDARVRLSQVLNINEALKELREMLLKQVKAACKVRQTKSDEISKLLAKSATQSTVTDELDVIYDEIKAPLRRAELSQIINALGENVTCQRMLDDLDHLQEEGKRHNPDSEFYLEFMGCEWARYIKTISNDVKGSRFLD